MIMWCVGSKPIRGLLWLRLIPPTADRFRRECLRRPAELKCTDSHNKIKNQGKSFSAQIKQVRRPLMSSSMLNFVRFGLVKVDPKLELVDGSGWLYFNYQCQRIFFVNFQIIFFFSMNINFSNNYQLRMTLRKIKLEEV